MDTFFDTLLQVLRQDKRFFSDEGELLRNAVYEAAMGMDPALIGLLFTDEACRARFFTQAGGVQVFDKVGFAWVVNNREFWPDSYTRYANRIGLADSRGDFLGGGRDVELVFPYKDCVLEGGQTREDQKRGEIFYNETLAPDRVDRLLDAKAFSGAVRYGADGPEPVETFSEADNLFIEGNNLLAVSSLLERYEGRVKLIYIDPPYNTGSDSFGYNDRFRRSTWLTFLKNRLEVAKKLLREDGAIYVQLDYNQVHYAKVLMDEIFGEENFQREIIWRIGWVSGYKTAVPNYIRNHDTILFYSKDADKMAFQKNYIDNAQFAPKLRDTKPLAKAMAALGADKAQIDAVVDDINHGSRPARYPIEDVWNGSEYDDLNSIAIVSFSGETVSKMLGSEEVKGQKSEKLVERILEAHTEPGDLVLDFFGGTGTTAAVAHKMGRRYILVEQMEKHVEICRDRLLKVIGGEQGGISRRQNWRGGGSFVFCRLAQLNAAYADRIRDAADTDTLAGVWEEIKSTGYISCRVEPRDVDFSDPALVALGLDGQKRLLMELLDKNQLYVNLCDLEDEEMPLTAQDRAFTRSFYGEDA